MRALSVILLALITSVLTSAGTVYVLDRYDLVPKAPKAPATPVAEVPQTALVPPLQGLTEADARANATAAHVTLFIASREQSRDVKPGSVIRQSVAAGQSVPKEHPINVVLAADWPKIPALSGLNANDAKRLIEERGFQLVVGDPITDPSVAKGMVVSQTPAADSLQPTGANVTVRLSAGPGDVEVPKLLGVPLAKAKADIEALGLKPLVTWVGMAETTSGVVLSQKPAPGEKLKPNGSVQIVVNR